MNGPWCNWDEPLEGQSVYFQIEDYPDRKTATEELRRVFDEVGETNLLTGRAKKKVIHLCMRECEEHCSEPEHQVPTEVWVYVPTAKSGRAGPPKTMRCPSCRLLCLTSSKTGKTYVHGAWIGHKVGRCPGSKKTALDPAKTKRVSLTLVADLSAEVVTG